MKITDIKHRNELPQFLNENNLCGVGAEIGVRYGDFSNTLLMLWEGTLLYSVDSWLRKGRVAPPAQVARYLPDHPDTDMNLGEYLYTRAKNKLQHHEDRSIMLKMTSEKAAKVIEDNSLDFCFIDASHRYEHVLQDCNLWWPKIKAGGVLCGHDYGFVDGVGVPHPGVARAVDEFINSNNLDLHHDTKYVGQVPDITPDDTYTYNESSWYTIKKSSQDHE
jgi:cephalosporin hydroxylase